MLATTPSKRNTTDMTSGIIWRHIATFALPSALGLLFQQLYNTVDSVVVGRFVGKQALAAVGGTTAIVSAMVCLCVGLSLGSTITISQAYGARDYHRLQDAVHTAVALTVLLAVFATALGLVLVVPLLNLMDIPPDVFDDACLYLRIYFCGLLGLFLYNIGSAILRAVGNSRQPLYFLMFSAILNIALDLVFVVAFRLGVAGVAYATVLAQFISAALVLYVLSRSGEVYALNIKKIWISRYLLYPILSIGMTTGIQQAITSVSNVFVMSYINQFGSSCTAGYSSFVKLEGYVTLPLQSIAMATTTFVGQNYGAHDLVRAKKGISTCLLMAACVTVTLSTLLLVFRRQAINLFSTDSEVIDFGSRFLLRACPFYVFTCLQHVFSSSMRGIGIARAPTIILLSTLVAFRQLYLFIGRSIGITFEWVLFAFPIGWVSCGLLMAGYFMTTPLGLLLGVKRKDQ